MTTDQLLTVSLLVAVAWFSGVIGYLVGARRTARVAAEIAKGLMEGVKQQAIDELAQWKVKRELERRQP